MGFGHQIYNGLRTPAMASANASARLNAYVAEGVQKSQAVVQALQDETARRKDALVPREAMKFIVTPADVRLGVEDKKDNKFPDPLGFTDWAYSQAMGNLGVPQKFINGLQEDGLTGAAIAARTLNDLRYRIGGEAETNGRSRRLLRVVDNTVKGWLSSTYGMFDQTELLGGFVAAIQNAQRSGIVFTEGVITDRRYSLTAIWPHLIEVWPGEFVVMGGQLQSSDYGFGAVDFKQQVIRLICRNGAIGHSFFRKIHRGSGFEGDHDEVFEVSQKTRELGAQTTISLLTDAVSGAFAEKAIDKAVDAYRTAATSEVNPLKEAETLRKKGLLTEAEQGSVPVMLAQEVEFLPNTESKNSALRFGQLLAWMAGPKANGETKIELMERAGGYMGLN